MDNPYVDATAITQVIGCVFNKIELLEDTDKYLIKDIDFVDDFHKILFGTMYNLFLNDSAITIDAIIDYLSVRPKYEAIFKVNQGVDYLINASNLANLDTFNYYYNRLKKFTLLREFDKIGVDVTYFYNPLNVLDTKKKQEQEDWLDMNSLSDISTAIINRINTVVENYVEDDGKDGYQAADGMLELIENLEKHPEVGIPLYGPLINTVTRGARLKKFYLRSGATGTGKAIPTNTLLPTPFGFKQAKDIKIGDFLFDRNGIPTKVTGVFPQENLKEVYKITFNDGREALCCIEHLWSYYSRNGLLVTAPLHKILKKFKEGQEIFIPTNKAVNFDNTIDIVQDKYFYEYGLESGINHLALDEKYLFSTIANRADLMLGLLMSGNNKEIFITHNKILAQQFISLCNSLGLSAPYEYKNAKYYIRITKKAKLKIVNIEAMDYVTDMVCFTVDNEEHLFLMNDYIVTHNTRTMIADACNFACDEIFDLNFNMWIKNGSSMPTLFITTEQEKNEVQTMMIAFLSGVNEEHILNGQYLSGERERVLKAIEIFKRSPIWIEELPDFSLIDVENKIKKYIREHNVSYIVYDYIHTSMKILEEITRQSGGIKLREDNILFMLSTRLKDLCNKYGIFILSGTQLNGQYTASETPDQNLLRGAKSIADKLDIGMILLNSTPEDLAKLEPILSANSNFEIPNIKLSIYKNRRGSYKGVYLWCKADLSVCRVIPQFCTTYNHELINIENIKVIINEEEE